VEEAGVLGVHRASRLRCVKAIAPPPPGARFSNYLAPEWHRVIVHGTDARIEIATRGELPIQLIAADYSDGLPPQGAPLARARTAAHGVASGEGDITITMTRLER